LQDDFENLKSQLTLSTVEHVGLANEYLVDPEFLIVLAAESGATKIFGLHYCELQEFKNAILFRATELMGCSMVDPILIQCKARLVNRQGEAWFHYDPNLFGYAVTKENDHH
jgi:hypothetical protein